MSQNTVAPKDKFTVESVSFLNGVSEILADFYKFERAKDYAVEIGNDVVICHIFDDTGKHMGRTYCMGSNEETTFGPIIRSK